MHDPIAPLFAGFLSAVFVHVLLLLLGLPFVSPLAASTVAPLVLAAFGAAVWTVRRRFGAFWLSWGMGHAGILAMFSFS